MTCKGILMEGQHAACACASSNECLKQRERHDSPNLDFNVDVASQITSSDYFTQIQSF